MDLEIDPRLRTPSPSLSREDGAAATLDDSRLDGIALPSDITNEVDCKGYFHRTIDKQIVIVLPDRESLPSLQELAHLLVNVEERKIDTSAMHGVSSPLIPPSPDSHRPQVAPDATDEARLRANAHPQGVELLEATPDDQYYLSFAFFEVEETIFMVPTCHLVNESAYFRRFFFESPGVGWSEETPVVLKNISVESFTALLSVIHPMEFPGPSTSTEEWVLVLELSFQWKMARVYHLAQSALDTAGLSWGDRIRLGTKCGNKSWVLRGYTTLVTGTFSFAEEDAILLGPSTLLKIMAAREKLHETGYRSSQAFRSTLPPASPNNNQPSVDDLIHTALQDELSTFPEMTPCEKIEAARLVGCSDLLAQACTQLVQREKSIDVEELNLLGINLTLKILNTRIALRTQYIATSPQYSGTHVNNQARISILTSKFLQKELCTIIRPDFIKSHTVVAGGSSGVKKGKKGKSALL